MYFGLSRIGKRFDGETVRAHFRNAREAVEINALEDVEVTIARLHEEAADLVVFHLIREIEILRELLRPLGIEPHVFREARSIDSVESDEKLESCVIGYYVDVLRLGTEDDILVRYGLLPVCAVVIVNLLVHGEARLSGFPQLLG
jgi:hypothetical protein